MLRQILEECKQGLGEVVIMVANTAASAEVFASLDELRISGDNVVSVLPEDSTHVHMYLDNIKKVKFIFKASKGRLPSYSVWFIDQNEDPVFRIYLRETDNKEYDRARQDRFMRLKQKYGDMLPLEGD